MFEVRVNNVQQAVSGPMYNPSEFKNVKAYAAKPKRGKQHGVAQIRAIKFDNSPSGRIKDESTNGIFIITEPSQVIRVGKDKLVEELDQLGPSFDINFEVKIKKFKGQVLQLTSEGFRESPILAVKALRRKLYFHVKILNKFVKFSTRGLRKNVWYKIVMSYKFTKRGQRLVKFTFLMNTIY